MCLWVWEWLCACVWRRVDAVAGFTFQDYNCNLHRFTQFDQSHWFPPQCLAGPSKSLASLGTMSLCPVHMTSKLIASCLSVGDEGRCPRPNAPTPCSPHRMGLCFSGSLQGTSCWAGWQTEMCPWPSWTHSGVMLVCTAAGSRSPGGSMTIRSTHTWSWRKVTLLKMVQRYYELCYPALRFFCFRQLLWNSLLLRTGHLGHSLVGHKVSNRLWIN